jgi:transcriptional regulator with XRE-family HTH domain
MSRPVPPEVKPHEIDEILEALGMNKSQLATLCNARPSTISWWYSNKAIPTARLSSLAHQLALKINATPELEKGAEKAIATFCRILGKDFKYFLDQATKYPVIHPRGKLEDNVNDEPLPRLTTEGVHYPVLKDYSIELLVDEIEKRGWTVNLSRKENRNETTTQTSP